MTAFSLVSANNKDFDFGQEGYYAGSFSHEFASVNLLRFAELEPHLVVAEQNRNSTQPIDLNVSVKFKKIPPIHVLDVNDSVDGQRLYFLIAIVLGGILFITFMIIIIKKLMRKCKCKCCKGVARISWRIKSSSY